MSELTIGNATDKYKEICTRLWKTRENLNITKKELANVFNSSEQVITAIENGEDDTTITKILAYAKCFGRSIGDLLTNWEHVKPDLLNLFDKEPAILAELKSLVTIGNVAEQVKGICNRLQKIRKENDITEKELANILDMSVEELIQLENGEDNVALTDIMLYAEYFGLDGDKLIITGELVNFKE